MAKRLHVGNLAFNVTQNQIRQLFEQAGEISEIDLVTDRYTGTPKGFAFVEMATEEAASEAIKRFDTYLLNDRALAVNEARPREERSTGSSSPRKGNGSRD
jgi:cold-inducible RNA-binding protein